MWWALWCAWLVLSAHAQLHNASNSAVSRENKVVIVAVGQIDSSNDSGINLVRALVTQSLEAGGSIVRAEVAPDGCLRPAARDAPICQHALLRALREMRVHVAVLSVQLGLLPPSWLLRDAGLAHLGNLAPPVRRVCMASHPSARSLLDLAEEDVAAAYHIPFRNLHVVRKSISIEDEPAIGFDGDKFAGFVPSWCSSEANDTCATIFTIDASERDVLAEIIRRYHLRAHVLPLGKHFSSMIKRLDDNPMLICVWTTDVDSKKHSMRVLGPPPCTESYCPFDPHQIVKLANVRYLSRFPSAIRSLTRLTLNAEQFRTVTAMALKEGAEVAAQNFLHSHTLPDRLARIRIGVLLPISTRRETYDPYALAEAAILAEKSLESERVPRAARLKVEVYDDECLPTKAYKYLIDELGTGEYGALSAAAGPACAGAFADVARQSYTHALPVLAYTPQPVPSDESLALLAAGNAHERLTALAAILHLLNWHRIVVLSEPATRPLIDASHLQSDIILHVELPDDDRQSYNEILSEWARRAVELNGRIIYVCTEDVRVVRAALCAGWAAGLHASRGIVWLLPQMHAQALQPAADDLEPVCSAEQLANTSHGHLTVRDNWQVAAISKACIPSADPCPSNGYAAVLYDTLRLWGHAVDALKLKPAALDDMHDPNLVASLVTTATTMNYTGITGAFEWRKVGNVYIRDVDLLVVQIRNGTENEVGRWSRGRLSMDMSALQWPTVDGVTPNDGDDRCAVRGLARTLGVSCSAAGVFLAMTALALATAAAITAALICRHRIERKYKARFSALGIRTYVARKDRWELKRERVVINHKLGTGAFGTVYGGHALIAEDRGWTAVAVKILKPGASIEDKLDFLSEAESMKRFEHKNIVKLLGVVTESEPVCTVMEYMFYGDLKNYLLVRRHLVGSPDGEDVSPTRLTAMALDVARALSYLAQMRYVHRDVAARNCLVSASRIVKLADFGMTRLIFENDYYRFSRKGMLPVRWMAPESVSIGVFSTASDVWSFGVLLYEIVTFGALPFEGLSNSEVLARVKSGQMLELPSGMKPQLEGLIKSCWQQKYQSRPTAADVAAFLADSPRLLTPCLDVSLDALPFAATKAARDGRWTSWATQPSGFTDTTDLSAELEAFLNDTTTP